MGTDTFIKESSHTIQDHKNQDRICTESMMNAVECIENETNHLVTGIRSVTENGTKTQKDVTNKIQSSQKEVFRTATADLAAVGTVLENGEKSIVDEIDKSHATVSTVENCLEVGVNETFLTSINKQKKTIKNSRVDLEKAMNNHETRIIDDVTKSSSIVSSTTNQLNHLTSNIIPLQVDTPELDDRNVLVFSEELTSTQESKMILLESAIATKTTCIRGNETNDNGK